MPPKVARRPAARVRQAAKAKAAARLGLRRPARAEGTPQELFERFEEVKACAVDPSELLTCGKVWCTEVVYWKEKTQCAGVFKSLRFEEGEGWMELQVAGTTSEHLLKHLSGVAGGRIRGHLCPEGCAQEISADDILHLVKVKKVKAGEEEDWMKNLLAAGGDQRDELEALRREARLGGGASPLREAGDGAAQDKKAKKEKKKAKEKKAEEKRPRSPSQGGQKRKGGRDLGVILGGSGLDPDPRKRKRYLKKAKKLMRRHKRKKKSSNSSSSSSERGSSRSSSSFSSMGGASEVFGQTRMAKRLAGRFPGVLTACSLAAIQEQLLTTQGQLWEIDKREIPPLFLQYFRSNLASRMTPAMRREALHLSVCLDLGLQGRIPEMLDVLGQRLKALESQTAGKHWTVTTQFELVPEEQGSVATSQETEAAMKEAREAGKLRTQASRAFGTSTGQDRWEDWRRDQPKGKGQKGQGKGKDWRREGKGDSKDPRREKEGDREKEKAKGKWGDRMRLISPLECRYQVGGREVACLLLRALWNLVQAVWLLVWEPHCGKYVAELRMWGVDLPRIWPLVVSWLKERRPGRPGSTSQPRAKRALPVF